MISHKRALMLISPLLLALGSAAGAADGGDTPDKPATQQADNRYNLRQLVALARASYPGVKAARYAIEAMERDVYRARWAWLPQGKLEGLLAPAPELLCFNAQGQRDSANCVRTTEPDVNSFEIAGVLARIRLELGMPIFTFGKLSAAKRAAAAGVSIREAQLASTEDRVSLDVARAYWGLKLAREILYTINDGMKYLVDAEERIEKELDEGEGEYTVTDLLRLKTAHAEVDVRLPEAQKLEKLAKAALAILIGKELDSFAVDTEILEMIEGEPLPLATYQQLAHEHRPELRLLQQAVVARDAAVDLERARLLPDFLIVGMVTYASTSSVDNPENAFYSDPFNTFSAGIGLALNWKLDHVLQLASYRKAQAEQRQTAAQRQEGLRGIALDIATAYENLSEARQRQKAAAQGERQARRWLAATSQNLAAGLAETRDLTDALLAYFQMRLKHLQAMFDVNVGWSKLGHAIGTKPARQASR